LITINLFARQHRIRFFPVYLSEPAHEFERALEIRLVDVVKAPMESLDQADFEIG